MMLVQPCAIYGCTLALQASDCPATRMQRALSKWNEIRATDEGLEWHGAGICGFEGDAQHCGSLSVGCSSRQPAGRG